MTHLTFEQISDLADSSASVENAPPHLAECSECRETLRKMRQLIAAAHKLPRDIAPPPEVWSALRSRVALGPSRRTRARGWYIGIAAAAAVILIAILVPRGAGKAKGAKLPVAAAIVVAPAVLTVERNYSPTLDELRHTLETQRSTLSPATIRVLEHSLATIDTAIAEARAALASDPANEVLVRILSTNYARKVELLQRVTELSSSS